MSYGELTVGDLRKALEGFPDDSPVLVKPSNGEEFSSLLKKDDRDRVIEHCPSWVVRWNYNTRHLHNAYSANDDRFTQNQVIVLELGELSQE